MTGRLGGLAVSVLLLQPLVVVAQERAALVVSGATGGGPFVERYASWRASLVSKLRDGFTLPPARLVVLAEAPGEGELEATREQLEAAVERLRATMGPSDLLLVVLMGHGSFDGADAKFNLVGPDLDALAWRELLDRLPGRQIVVNTASASFPFLEALSSPRRVVVTATDSAAQQFATVFGEYFIQGLDDPEADLDKNSRVSIWETFMFASARVRQYYEQRGQLATERPLIDDNGDGLGKEAGAPGPDGPAAGRTYFDAETPPPPTDPELAELYQRRATLEAQADELKLRKPLMPESDYAREFERLMIELARVSRAIRKKS